MKLVFEEGATKYTKKDILESLYSRKMDMAIHIDRGEYIEIATVDFRGLDGNVDCLIGNFSNNWYTRPLKGVQGKEYTSMAGLLGAVKGEIDKLHSTIYKIVITKYGTKEKICEFI